MAVPTHWFVGELHRRGVRKGVFAQAHGIHSCMLSMMLKAPSLPDEFLQTLARIAPMPEEAEAQS